MKKVICSFNHFVFLATTLTIAGVFYEGMALKWFDIVAIFILVMDGSFIVATIANIWAERQSKWLYAHIFSVIIILIAIVLKLLGIKYPTITLVLWYFYVWFLYGISVVRCYMR